MKNIAIFRRNGLGDLLTTFPLIAHLKKEHPLSSITLFVGENNHAITPFLSHIDEVVVLPNKGNKYLTLLYEVWKKRKGYDLALSAKTSPMKLMNLALYASGAKERRAYVDGAWHSKLVNHPSYYKREEARKKHQALQCLHLVAPHFTEVPEDLYPKMEVPFGLYQPYLSYFSEKEPTIFISASTTRKENCFDSVRYARLLNALFAEYPFRVCIVSMPKDEMRARLIAGHLQMPHKLAFTRTFEEFLALLKLSDMVFVGDGGVAHIAAALDKPQVVLFGESHPGNWHPLSKKTTVLYHPLHVNLLQDQKIYNTLLCKINSLVVG